MAWTTPITFTTGNVLTAAQMNTNVRDNTNYLFDQPMALVTNSANISIPNTTVTSPNIATTVYSSPGITIGAGVFTPTIAGAYQAWANGTWAGSAVGQREAGLLTGVFLLADDLQAGSGSRNTFNLNAMSTKVMNGSTDTIILQVAQTSGGALNLLGTATASTLLSQGIPLQFGIKMLGTGS